MIGNVSFGPYCKNVYYVNYGFQGTDETLDRDSYSLFYEYRLWYQKAKGLRSTAWGAEVETNERLLETIMQNILSAWHRKLEWEAADVGLISIFQIERGRLCVSRAKCCRRADLMRLGSGVANGMNCKRKGKNPSLWSRYWARECQNHQ